jgi:flagellar motor switch protein FliN/FliY
MSANPESTEPVVDKPAQEDQVIENEAKKETTTADPDQDSTGVEVQTPEFQEFSKTSTAGAQNEISRFHDICVTVSAELGRTRIPIQKLLSLGSGSVLELDRNINSPIELIAQGVPLASGEVVVVDDCFAIRITEVYPNEGS